MFTGFGQTAAQQQPTLSFGAPSAAQNPASTSFGFGAAAPAASSAAPSFGFGAPTFSAAPPASTGFQFGATTSSVAPSFGFGGQTNTTASTGFPLGAAPASSAPSFSFSGGTGGLGTGGFGLIGAATSSAPSFSGLTTNVITTTTTAPSLGLGGISSAPFGGESAASTVQGKADSKALKELPVPNEISQHVEEFKKHVKDQKSMKEEVSRGSSKALEKVGEEVETLKNLLANLANNIQQHSALLHKLKHDSALEIQNAEIAQRTKETAPSLQLDNTSPVEYFFRLVADFEQRMQFYKQQIENTERNLLAMNRQQTLTPRELMDTMKKLHEAFLLLCGRVQSVHSALQNCKDDYLSYRRRFLGDSTDIFAPKGSVGVKTALASQLQSRAGTGPSPFGAGSADPLSRTISHLTSGIQQGGESSLAGSSHSFHSSFAQRGGLMGHPSSALAGSGGAGLGFGTPSRPAGGGLFGSPSVGGLPTENRSFQLQSPPPGNKRNKR